MPTSIPSPTRLRPLSARSVVLSLLLGVHPPQLPVRDLVVAAELFGIAEGTLRVALTRMVRGGDLVRTEGGYRLTDRLLARQRRQDESIEPDICPWGGDWEMAVITASGRSAAERAALRADLIGLRLAERREGVWLRPQNLRRAWPPRLGHLVERYTVQPGQEPGELAARLWDLAGWARSGRELLARFDTTAHPAERIAAAAAMVRHLATDPILPAPLLPEDWPGQSLRDVYAGYQAELLAMIRTLPSAQGSPTSEAG